MSCGMPVHMMSKSTTKELNTKLPKLIYQIVLVVGAGVSPRISGLQIHFCIHLQFMSCRQPLIFELPVSLL